MENPWKANSGWIWLPEWNANDGEYPRLVYFRKSFQVKSSIEKAVVRVSADSRYRLYLNGTSISFGPCKGDRFAWFYDEVDLAPYLKTGENVLAAVVLRYPTVNGKGNFSIWRTDIPGFYLEDASGVLRQNGINIDTFNSCWKAKKNTDVEILPEGRQNFLWIKEQASGNERLAGWNNTGYCDDDWMDTVPYNKFRVNKSISPGSLSPRPIPMLYERHTRFAEAFCLRNSMFTEEAWNACLKGGNPLTIPANSHERVEISAGELTTGFLQLAIAHGKGSKIKILSSECYAYPPKENDEYFAHPIKGNRIDCEKGRLYGMEDHYMPAGYGTEANPEYYEPFWFRTFRFVALEITTGNEPLTLISFDYRETGYPLEVYDRNLLLP